MNKNILILCPSLKKGGAERVVSLIAQKWSENKHYQIHLLLLEDGVEYEVPKNANITILSKTNKSSIRKFMELPIVSYKLAKFIKTQDIDIAISFLYRPNYVNLIAKKLFRSNHKVIINIRSTTSIFYRSQGLLGRINLLLVKLLYNKADAIISNSKGVEDDLNKVLKITTHKQVIYNPVNISENSLKVRNLGDKSFVFKKNLKYIISLGRLIPLKRNFDLINAFYECQSKKDNIRLIFLGDGFLKNKLKDYCVKLKIDSKVEFLGNVSNPFYYLSQSDIFILTSEVEGFPNALLEAMACELPVISSNCKSGPSELLDDGKYGILYKTGEISILSSNINKLLNDDALASHYSKMSKIRSQKFRIESILPEYTKLLDL